MGLYEYLKDIAAWELRARVRAFAAGLPEGTRLLDAGAGQCQYKPYFAHCRYVSVDTGVGDEGWDYSHLDVVAPLESMPFGAGEFDAVLCTEVLEHVNDPFACVREMRRVLRPGGRLLLTVPFFHLEHQAPHDYYRYTSHGLRHLARMAGFAESQIRVDPIGGVFLRWAYEVSSLFDIYPWARVGFTLARPSRWLAIPFAVACTFFIRALQLGLVALSRAFDSGPSLTAPFGWEMIATVASDAADGTNTATPLRGDPTSGSQGT